MSELCGLKWIDTRIKEKASDYRAKVEKELGPRSEMVNAEPYCLPLVELSRRLTLHLERAAGPPNTNEDPAYYIARILRHSSATYHLLLWINAEDTRFGAIGYYPIFSSVSLPLIRTMIDCFYNATLLLNYPDWLKRYKISSYYRIKKTIERSESSNSNKEDIEVTHSLTRQKEALAHAMQKDGINEQDLGNKAKKWPLLSEYVNSATGKDEKYRNLLNMFMRGAWDEYSSISHASYSAYLDSFLSDTIAKDCITDEQRREETGERWLNGQITWHIGRAASTLLSLITEIQAAFDFEIPKIDEQLLSIWTSMLGLDEPKELYSFRYREILEKLKKH